MKYARDADATLDDAVEDNVFALVSFAKAKPNFIRASTKLGEVRYVAESGLQHDEIRPRLSVSPTVERIECDIVHVCLRPSGHADQGQGSGLPPRFQTEFLPYLLKDIALNIATRVAFIDCCSQRCKFVGILQLILFKNAERGFDDFGVVSELTAGDLGLDE